MYITTHHSGQDRCPCKISDRAVVVGCPLGRSTSKYDCQLFVIANTGECKPYCMQSVSQSPFSTLASNEFLQNFKFLCATRFDSARIVKNVTQMIGEHKFVVDVVLASLAPCLEATEREVLLSLTSIDGSSLTWSAVRSDSQTKGWTTYLSYPHFPGK
jgi:hypothetical protein